MSMKFNPEWLTIKDRSERFWAFYNENKSDFERILWNASWKHKKHIDPKDMHAMLMLRIYDSNFLEEYDPLKSQFGTFVMSRVNGYSYHILGEETRDNFSKDYEVVKIPRNSTSERTAGSTRYVGERIDTAVTRSEALRAALDYQELIGDKYVIAVCPVKHEIPDGFFFNSEGSFSDEEGLPGSENYHGDFQSNCPDFEETLSNRQIIWKILKRLTKAQIHILKMYWYGSSIRDIAKEMGLSVNHVTYVINKIKKIAVKVVEQESKE